MQEIAVLISYGNFGDKKQVLGVRISLSDIMSGCVVYTVF